MGATTGSGGTPVERPWTAATAQVLVEDASGTSAPEIDGQSLHHLRRVLRLRPGEIVCATDGAGGWCLTEWTGDGRLEPTGDSGRQPAPSPVVSVAFVPVKGDRPELVTQKLTELGVDRIVVTSSARAVVRWDGERTERHLERLRRVAAEACGQCRRLWSPTVEAASLSALSVSGAALADPGGREAPVGLTSIVVGPEGGWTDQERAAAHVPPVLLGEHVLRSETAAIAAGVVLTMLRRTRSPGPVT